jgi:hypothetical protein
MWCQGRAGPSYKSLALENVSNDQVFYTPASKGYSVQKVSSFTLGPVVEEGLCLVNAAFSKCICISHIEGGGKVDYKRKCFWRPSRTPQRVIERIGEENMVVDGELHSIREWLEENEDL